MRSMAAFRAAVLHWGRDTSGVLIPRYWGFFFAAFVLAAAVAEQVYRRLNLPQRYAELIVGSITWSYENKFHDYAVLYAVIGAFLIAVTAIAWLAVRLSKCAGRAGVDRLHEFVLVLCLPAVLWSATLLTTKSASLELLRLSQLLLVVGLGLAAALISRGPEFWSGARDRLFSTLHHAFLFIVFAALGVAALGVAGNRVGAQFHLQRWMGASLTAACMVLAACAALAACLVLSRRAPSPEGLLVAVRRLAMGTQCLLPLFLLCLVPPAWITPEVGALEAGYPLSALAKLLIVGSIAVAYVELYVRTRRCARSPAESASPLQLLTIGSAVGLLLFLKTTPLGLPHLLPDDYHFGERLVPWWSWFTMGLVPFWDYAPARGLVNYLPGFLGSALFGGAPASFSAAYPVIYAALAAIAIPVLRPLLGMGGVMVALLLGPLAHPEQIGEIDLGVSIFLFAFCGGWLHWRRDRWLAGLAAAAVLLLLFAPGQGALALLACAPLAFAALWSLYQADRRRLGLLLLGIGGVLALLFGLTPLGKMFYGALRYGAEQSQINSVAHGIQWRMSFGAEGLNPWAFELMRASFVLVAMWAGVLVFKAAFMADAADRRRILAYAVPVLLVTSLFVIRAAGRIDPGGSRLAIASVWALSLLLPMLIFVAQRPRAVHFVIWVGIMGPLMPYVGSLAAAGYAGNFNPPDASTLLRTPNAASIENGRLGSAIADPAHLNRIAAVRNVLDQVLDPRETYLDLSGRHAMYYYVERKPAVESASPYNLVGEKQQLRAIEAFRAAPPPAILLSADNIVHDGGPSSLRSNLLYREVVLSKGYKLVSVDKQVWLIRPDRVDRLTAGAVAVDLDSPAAVSALDPIFHLQNLESLPASWGRSAKTLEKGLAPVLRIASDVPSSMNAVRALGDGRYAITGEDPHVRFDVSGSQLSGRQAGLLSFEFSCESPDAAPMVGVYWSTSGQPEGAATFMTFRGRQGRLIVPVDSAPSWLLAGRINTVRLDVDGITTGCETFAIRHVELLARRATMKVSD